MRFTNFKKYNTPYFYILISTVIPLGWYGMKFIKKYFERSDYLRKFLFKRKSMRIEDEDEDEDEEKVEVEHKEGQMYIPLKYLYFDEKVADFIEKELGYIFPVSLKNNLVYQQTTLPLRKNKYDSLHQDALKSHLSVVKECENRYYIVNGRHRITKFLVGTIVNDITDEHRMDMQIPCQLYFS